MSNFRSARAQLIADMARDLPEQVRREVRQALGEDLAVLQPEAIRAARLGLLRRLVSVGTGEVPPVRVYSQYREEASVEGEQWPSVAALIDHFGDWDLAVLAAMRLQHGARTPSTKKHLTQSSAPKYGCKQSLEAVASCREFYGGGWPFPEQFYRWRTLCRQLAAHDRKPEPRIPDRKAVRRLFGGYEAMLVEAQKLEAGAPAA
jgi:hypothetical protein